MYEKVYADKKRGAKVSDIEVGDRVILRKIKTSSPRHLRQNHMKWLNAKAMLRLFRGVRNTRRI